MVRGCSVAVLQVLGCCRVGMLLRCTTLPPALLPALLYFNLFHIFILLISPVGTETAEQLLDHFSYVAEEMENETSQLARNIRSAEEVLAISLVS